MYLFERLEARYEVEIVPGVSSIMAGAAALRRPLTARNDILTVIPGPVDTETLRARIDASDAVAIMKVGRHFARIRDLIREMGLIDRAGYFLRPTIVRDVTDGDQIVDEEQFGPILPVIRFSDIDDVVARANASPYGLGASVWSRDVDRALAVAERIESGSVWVNQHVAIGPHIPMAGVKSSGLGVEQAEEGLAEYTQFSVINVARGG